MKLMSYTGSVFVTGWLFAATLTVSFPPLQAATPAQGGPAATTSAQGIPAAARNDAVENSVVKVFSTVRYPDYFRPWTKESPSEISGTGVVIEGKRILSNAHVVSYASQVQIQANKAGDKISATVVAVDPGIDLAVLKLDDETFFDTHAPLERAKALPEIKDAVMVYGYPTGGSSLSITKGIVSRIEFAPYNYQVSGLRIQIDAAINPGNSGGPAVAGDKMIGLAFSHLQNAENIGYIIPCEEIELFLQDVAAGRHEGKPGMFDDFQTLENPALRTFLKLDKSAQGIVVHRPASPDPAYPLKEWDLITKIGDTPVDDQGMVTLKSGGLRLHFTYLVQKTTRNGKVPLTLIRSGKEMQLDLPVQSRLPLVMGALEGNYPSYFVYGPLVFSTATQEFLATLAREESGRWTRFLISTGSPLLKRFMDLPAFPGERLVVVSSPFFPHKLAQGYSNPQTEVVKSVNGIAIKNLEHLVQVLRDCRDEMISIEFDSRSGEALVFRRVEITAATEEILTDNGVRSQGSADTLSVWNAKN
jgi:S1-C subfamily serine protease